MDFTQESENLLTRKGLLTRPIDFWSFTNDPRMVNAEPNIIHQKIFEMEQKGILSGVVTQNIEGFDTQVFSNAAPLEVIQERDNIKREFCKKHNIKLIEIPYSKKGRIKIDDLLI